MIARIKNYWQARRFRAQKLREARKLLEAMAGEAAYAHYSEMLPLTDRQIRSLLLSLGAAHLRAVKGAGDRLRATREIELRIKQGPRPSRQEAQAN